MADYARDPRAYELMAIFVPELSDEELVEQLERVTGYITDQTGTITEVLRESPWGRRRLAYTMRFNSVDYRDGIYVVYHFDSIPSVVTDIERELKLDVRVMRYLLVHDDPLAGEKDTGQAVEGDEATTEATAGDATPAASEPAAESADAQATENTLPAEAEPAPAEETPEETESAPAEETPDEAEPAPAEEVSADPEPAATKAAPSDGDVDVETPDSDPKAIEEETKED